MPATHSGRYSCFRPHERLCRVPGRAVNARGHFPTEQAAMKCLYLAIRSLDPTGKGRKRWTNRWKAALNAFDITFDGRLSGGRK
jgi:putative transposase